MQIEPRQSLIKAYGQVRLPRFARND